MVKTRPANCSVNIQYYLNVLKLISFQLCQELANKKNLSNIFHAGFLMLNNHWILHQQDLKFTANRRLSSKRNAEN